MEDKELIARAIQGCVVGNGSKQIELLIGELARICSEVKYVRSQSFWPHMGEFSRGYQTACDEILERMKPFAKVEAGKLTLEHLAKRLSDVERWIERREDYESEQREQ
ncbi:hypothetical protein VN12_02105 [Pirellula sp. SH-Sr6A]|uniref:hypothetical protein n=1 Tax=Pirellula sp. SH-Sr6A TaxID=1632865 RepID=UPI00078D74B9|nr:hypothetical protein [Pirellula sp. SH-Sr6A]AMV30879.1 hypothetical protein VN12_02105 [Pirellula sp. SH-Sr6A]